MKLVLSFLFIVNFAFAETRNYAAQASWQGHTLYFEQHHDVFEDGKLKQSVIEYIDGEGKLIAFEEADFRFEAEVGEYFFRDFRHGLTQGINIKEGVIELYGRSGHKKPLKFKLLPKVTPGKWLVWPALVDDLGRNLESLINKRKQKFHWIIPGKLKAYEFYIEVVKYSRRRVELELELVDWVEKLFSPKVRMVFDREKQRLLQYEGPSRLRDAEGKMVSVEVEYHYPD